MIRYLLAGAFLTVLVLCVYSQTVDFSFVGFDDPRLVTENGHVRQGLTTAGARWSLLAAWRENVFFYPLSLLSHMADVSWFGLNAGRHHLTSVVLHTAAVLIFFTWLARLSRAFWRPLLAAGFFGLHPLAVDSVAWVAERSNVLCGLLLFATMAAYVQYRQARHRRWYGLSLGFYLLALLAKPTAVVAPVGLWLIHRPVADTPLESGKRRPGIRTVAAALWPFILLAGLRTLAVLAATRGGSPLTDDHVVTFGLLTANALVATATYILYVFYPFRLSVYYPFPESLPLWQPLAAGVMLLAITLAAFGYGRRRPLVLLGWLWYLAFLAPSLGVVRSGPWPAMADHYAYLPLAGLFIMLVWGFWPSLSAPRQCRTAAIAAGLLTLMYFAGVSFWHVGHYRDSVSLFSRAIVLDPENFFAYTGLGNAFRGQGKMELAEAQFRKAVVLKPDSAGAHHNLGLILMEKGEWALAERHFKTALALDPGFSQAQKNLRRLYLEQTAGAALATDRPTSENNATGPP